MRIFLTGATGFIGSYLVPELIGAGHQVLGLTRSDAGAVALEKQGADVHRGDVEDLDSLRSGAAAADGVIHCAFNHDFSKFQQNCENDRLAILAMGEALAGSGRPLVITSGVGFGSKGAGQPATENILNQGHGNPRIASELAALELNGRGGNVSVVRLPQVHDTAKQGLVTYLIELARQKGSAAYLDEGTNRFSAGHVTDVARLYRLVLERQQAGSVYNAVAEEGIAAREIAEAIGRGLSIPVNSLSGDAANEYFGWMSMFAAMDLSADSTWTRKTLGWEPTGPGLIADLDAMKM